MADKVLHYIHYSGNTFMPLRDTQEDVDWIVGREPDLVVITESAERETVQAIRDVVDHRMMVLNPDDGDITFLLSKRHRLIERGGPLVIPRKPGLARNGGHGPRHNSWVRFAAYDERITHFGVHFVTRHAGGQDREDEQLRQALVLGHMMSEEASGYDLATGSGDLNSTLPNNDDMQAVFDRFGMTTTAQEEHDFDATHGHARIDYVWTMDKDRRLHVRTMRVVKLRRINSDHNPVEVWLGIKERR